MIWLGIDTSCDDTSVAVTDGLRVLSNVVSSQDEIHREWGGVVPMLAKRAHEERFDRVLALALQRAGISPEAIDAIAVTQGPGLAPCLEVGVARANALGDEWQKPVYALNHMMGHLLAAFARPRTGRTKVEPQELQFPVLALLVSGGHTEMVLGTSWSEWSVVGETVDDALGEAYDKVARLLSLGYPGGATLARLAERGNPKAYALPVAMRQSGDLNVSYSGLKTASHRLIMELTDNQSSPLSAEATCDFAASFEHAALRTILGKMEKAIEQLHPTALILGGGVAVNRELRVRLRGLARHTGLPLWLPYTGKLCRDNGAMIAVAAELLSTYAEVKPAQLPLDRRPSWRIESLTP